MYISLPKRGLSIKPKFFSFVPDLEEYRNRVFKIIEIFERDRSLARMEEEFGTLIKDIMTIENISRDEAHHTVQYLAEEVDIATNKIN